MKTNLLSFVCSVCFVVAAFADTTIDPANPYAYGANIGWLNAEGDVNNGAVIGQAFCEGYMYSANCGWIHLGSGAPANGLAYQNDSATDYGVNHDGQGSLSGYAYGANIGWINFEKTYGLPKVDLLTGDLSGYAWGANVGWINLASLATLTIDPGPSADGDNIPDPWELGHTNTIWVLNGGDADGDGVLDEDEYLADTDPFDPNDLLVITDLEIMDSTNMVTWTAKPTRLYSLKYAAALSNGMSWAETSSPLVPASGPDVTEEVTGVSDTNRFYRVEVELPLSP